ncbi:MAG TPA: DegT/DnrJ/EryC1/StrS family aminotransferase [Pyrinomonadaceae bacterium]|nr:DegT/DnrJ/EryC1/StrS family aminotransferase [Pyrinomonadaceae bacterium]
MIPLVDLKIQYQSIKSEIDLAISEVVESSHFVLGPQVEAFEEELARLCETRFACGVNSGTSALHLALLAAGVGPGDEVITVSYTFVATAAAVLYTGAHPIFVDIDPLTCNIDPSRIESAITSRTKVIMPVHLHGSCADMHPIMEIARRHNLIVIEDAAQAVAADYHGRRAGSMGDLACFSFYPGKNLGAYGEAGAVVTNNEDHVKLIRQLRDHGQSEKYHHARLGYNYRMEAIQGAVLKVKLKYIDEWTKARRSHAAAYRSQLAELEQVGVRLLEETAGGRSVHHIFPVFTRERADLQRHLQAAGINTGIHYPIPVHLQSGYRDLGYGVGDFPHTEKAAAETLSLPMYPELALEDLTRVAETVREFSLQKLAVSP